MKHDTKLIEFAGSGLPLHVAVQLGIRRGRELHGAAVRAAFRACVAALIRRRTRSALAGLDKRLLEDIGVSRREASLESRKPFWRV